VIAVLLAVTSLFSFQTPSHNIGCVGDAHYIRCDTRYVTKYSQPRYKPPGCDLDWGPLSMGPRGRAHVICAGDTALNGHAPVLRYGTSRLYAGKFRCTSRATGLRCQNRSGHGWFLSRQYQTTF
jgi:uncharacterized protein DUF6636